MRRISEMLSLHALGALDLRMEDGSPAVSLLSQSKRAALLAYLAMARPGGLHRRDTLLALFWPDFDQARGRSALSQALSFLRRELGEGVVVTRGPDEVGIDPESVQSDVEDFRRAMREERWRAALEVYQGELLEGLHVTGAGPFGDWVDQERLRLREAAAKAAWALAHERILAGELVEAERTAQRALGLVPTDESPVRMFVAALARAGDRAVALRFFETYSEVLARELEVEPASETLAVVEAVRRGVIGPDPNRPMEALRSGVDPERLHLDRTDPPWPGRVRGAAADTSPMRKLGWETVSGSTVLGLNGSRRWPGTIAGIGVALAMGIVGWMALRGRGVPSEALEP